MLCLLIASVDAPEEKRKIEQLYEKYNRLMYSIAYKSLRNSYDAEDAVFSSWEKVIKNIDKIGEVDAPGNQGVSRGGRETYDHRYVSQKEENG